MQNLSSNFAYFMDGIVIAVYASFFLAISQAALKKSFREMEPSVSFFFDAFFGLLIWIPLAIVFGAKISELPQTLIYAIISAILSEAFYFYALSKGQLSVTAIIIATYPVYTIFFSFFINRESLNLMQAFFIGITIIGTLMSALPSKLNKKELWESGVIFWPIFAAIAVGLSDALSKKVIDQTSAFSFLFALALAQIPVALIYLKIEKQKALKIIKTVKKNIGEYKYPLLGSIFNIIGTGLLLLSFSYTMVSIASPITATSGAILVLLIVLFMDEKIKFKNFIGIALAFIGVLGLSFI